MKRATGGGARKGVSIIVPTLREAGNIEALTERVERTMTRSGLEWEIVFVDDDSNDGSEAIVAALATTLPVKMIVRRNTTPDLSRAVVFATRHARFERIVVMDADLSHPAERIPDLLRVLDGGTTMAIGSRYATGGTIERGWGAWRAMNSMLATRLARPLTRCTDPMSGFFAIERHAVPPGLAPSGCKIGLEIMVRGQLDVGEVPITFKNRHTGQSKTGWRTRARYIHQLARLYLRKGSTTRRMGWFGLAGACGFVVDMSTWTALGSTGLDHRIARTLAFFPAATTTWAINRRVTFADRKRARRTSQWARHVAAAVVALAINSGTYALLTTTIPWFDAHRIAAFLIGIGLGAGVNFALAHVWVFKGMQRN